MPPSEECFLGILSPVRTTVSSTLLVAISGRAEQRGTLRGCPAQTNKGKFAGSRERALCKVFVQLVLVPRTGAARNLTFIISVYGTACWKTC